jgi:hypothetical protein
MLVFFLVDTASPESIQTSLAFVLNVDDYKFLLNLDHAKKHGAQHLQTGYFEVKDIEIEILPIALVY